MEFKMEPLSISDDNEILGIVDNTSSITSSPHDEQMQYSLKQENDVVSYRVIQISDNKLPNLAPKIAKNITSNNTVSTQSCQFYLISNDLVSATNVTPKLQPISSSSCGGSNFKSLVSARQKRDDKRRATHNEVERRRRDKINHWIMKLGSIIPDDPLAQPAGCVSSTKSVSAAESQSKGCILSKACEYIPMLQENINSLNECLKDTETINLENEKLRETNDRLKQENERLRMILRKHGINWTESNLST